MNFLYRVGLVTLAFNTLIQANTLFEYTESEINALKKVEKFNSGKKGSAKYHGREGVLRHSYKRTPYYAKKR